MTTGCKTEPQLQHAGWPRPAIQKTLDIGLRHLRLRKGRVIGGAALMGSEENVKHPKPAFATAGFRVEDI